LSGKPQAAENYLGEMRDARVRGVGRIFIEKAEDLTRRLSTFALPSQFPAKATILPDESEIDLGPSA
jgi:hypothetical protein